jgi:hypothetical protein
MWILFLYSSLNIISKFLELNIHYVVSNSVNLNDKEDNTTKSGYENFLSRFRIVVCQKNVSHLKTNIILEKNADVKYNNVQINLEQRL